MSANTTPPPKPRWRPSEEENIRFPVISDLSSSLHGMVEWLLMSHFPLASPFSSLPSCVVRHGAHREKQLSPRRSDLTVLTFVKAPATVLATFWKCWARPDSTRSQRAPTGFQNKAREEKCTGRGLLFPVGAHVRRALGTATACGCARLIPSLLQS